MTEENPNIEYMVNIASFFPEIHCLWIDKHYNRFRVNTPLIALRVFKTIFQVRQDSRKALMSTYFHHYYILIRTDTGGLASICVFRSYSGTKVARILYHISHLRFYFSLSNDVVIKTFRQKMFKMEI